MLVYSIVREAEQQTASWSGGTTTELCIYPVSSQYSQRNFSVRVSTATVEVAQSDFTPLPGFQRHIMLLNGDMRLEHQGHHHVRLNPYDSDYFSGSWQTTSYGCCQDYNLMLAEDWSGRLETFSDQQLIIYFPNRLLTLYCVVPECQVILRQQGQPSRLISLNKHDFLSILPQPYDADLQLIASYSGPALIVACAWQKNS